MVVRKKATENETLIEKIGLLLIELDISYNNIENYILSFIHRSVVNERQDFAPEHNERLEFLGDSVLELVITEHLYRDFGDKPEGELTDIRSALVRGKNLSKITRSLSLNEYLILGRGEEKGGGRENDYLLANMMEAFIGAIYLDLGLEEARKFIDKFIYPSIENILKNNSIKDYKTLIQELAQAKFNVTPVYEVLSDEGPDHDKSFNVGIFFGKKQVGTGIGRSKKKAEEKAAEDAYEKLK